MKKFYFDGDSWMNGGGLELCGLPRKSRWSTLVCEHFGAEETNLATGGAYGDTSLDGYTLGLGFNNDMDNGMFVRFEAAVMDIDGATLVNKNDSTKKVTADGIEGISASLSLGKAF